MPAPAPLHALKLAASKNAVAKAQAALAKLDAGSEEVADILELAVLRGSDAVAAVILAAGARPRAVAPLLTAALRTDAAHLVPLLLSARPDGADVDAIGATGGWTPLFWAAKRGDCGAIGALLSAGARVNARERMGGTPLMVAVQHSHLEAAEALLAAGADVEVSDSAGWSAMLWAAQAGDAAMIQRLLQAGAQTASPGGSALMVAVENGRVDVVSTLLAAPNVEVADPASGANAENTNDVPAAEFEAARKACEDGKAVKGPSAPSSLHPTRLGPGVEIDLDARDAQGWSAVAVAAGAGHTKLLSMLLAAGASANARIAHSGRTPLMAAAQGGHAAAIDILIRHTEESAWVGESGANGEAAPVNGGKGGSTMPSVLGGVRALVDATDAQGVTALMLAAKNGHAAAVVSLLQADADACATDMAGHGALELSAKKGSIEVAKVLLHHAGSSPKTGGPNGAMADSEAGGLLSHAARALPIAARGGFADLVRLLADFGAPTQPHLMRAAAGGATEVSSPPTADVGRS